MGTTVFILKNNNNIEAALPQSSLNKEERSHGAPTASDNNIADSAPERKSKMQLYPASRGAVAWYNLGQK